jgi:chromosome segregation ATPase
MKEDSMSEDLTKKVPDVEGDKLTLILTIVRRIESHSTTLVQVIDRLEKLTVRVDAIETRLNAIETRLNAIESRLDAVDMGLQSLEQTVRRSVHHLGRGQSVLNDAILKIHIGLLDIDERFQRLEPRTSPTNSQT